MNYKYINQNFFDTFYGNNKPYKTKMISMFLERAPKYMENMQQHLGSKDWDDLGAMAHKFKSSIDFIGAPNLKVMLRQIQDFSDEKNNLDTLPDLVNRFNSDCNNVIQELQLELAR